MLQSIKALIIMITIGAFSLAQTIFITEITDPQNSSDAGRYVELYNGGTEDADFSTRDNVWGLQRWTNGNTEPQSVKYLTGTIEAGGYFIVCNNADKFLNTYGFACDQDIGSGGPADSNGDDNIALTRTDAEGTIEIIDMFGFIVAATGVYIATRKRNLDTKTPK